MDEDTISAKHRSAARLNAVQALYEMEVAGAGADVVIQEFMANRWANAVILDDAQDDADDLDFDMSAPIAKPIQVELTEPDKEFFKNLVKGVASQIKKMDSLIAPFLSSSWPMARLETVLRAILRTGAYELSDRLDIPARVIINEYVQIAQAFFEGKEPKLVNGLLDSLARHLRPNEFSSKKK